MSPCAVACWIEPTNVPAKVSPPGTLKVKVPAFGLEPSGFTTVRLTEPKAAIESVPSGLS